MGKQVDFEKIERVAGRRRKIGNLVIYTLLTLWAIVVLFPFYWMLLTSVKSYSSYNSEYVPKLFTLSPTLQNYADAFTAVPLAKYFANTFLFTIITEEVFLSIMITIGLIFSQEIISIFRDDADVISIANIALKAQLITLFLLPVSSTANMLFQSVGRNKEATLLASLRNGLAFIPALLILSKFFGLTGIELAQSVSDIITCSISIPFASSFLKKLPSEENEFS